MAQSPELKAAMLGVLRAACEVEKTGIEWIREGAPEEVEDAISHLGGSLDELASQMRSRVGRV